jgi:hypothetical protein
MLIFDRVAAIEFSPAFQGPVRDRIEPASRQRRMKIAYSVDANATHRR